MAILKIRDADGSVKEIIALKGDKGDKGDPGEFTGGELLTAHINNKENPHGVTAEQLGVAHAIESTDHPGCYYRIVNDNVEWINPPMVDGVEYRTTERWIGKAVYKKLRVFGTLPNNASKSIYLDLASDRVIKVEMQATNGMETFCEIGGQAYNGTIFVYDGVLHIRTTSDLSSFNSYVTVWYIKD